MRTLEFEMPNGTWIYCRTNNDFQDFQEISIAFAGDDSYTRTLWENLTLLEQSAIEEKVKEVLTDG